MDYIYAVMVTRGTSYADDTSISFFFSHEDAKKDFEELCFIEPHAKNVTFLEVDMETLAHVPVEVWHHKGSDLED